VLSFGFKYGLPPDADFVLDARFLPNPYWVPELRDHTGVEPEVSRYANGDGDLHAVAHLHILRGRLPDAGWRHKLTWQLRSSGQDDDGERGDQRKREDSECGPPGPSPHQVLP